MPTIPASILPAEQADQQRWKEQGLRIRLLNGKHINDVRDEIEDMFALEIAADMSVNPDLSRNPFKLIYQQLNVAYIEPPDVRVPEADDSDLSTIITPRLWAQQQGTSLYCLSLNEVLVRVDWKHWADATEASYRLVMPDTVVCEALPNQPDEPGMVSELRYRDQAWTWETWDIRDPKEPVFMIEEIDDNGDRVDATAKYAPELAGSYPYRNSAGDPILPYVMYHKQVGSKLWSWTKGTELSRGALRLAALWSHWSDGFLNCAFPQRYAIDIDTQAGLSRTIGGTPVDVVPVDRKSIIKFVSKGPGGGSLGQFQAAMDPTNAAESLRIYEQGLAVYAGLNPSDLQITQAQSGYAIVVSREGQRKAQKLVEPSFRMADQKLLATAAALSNLYAGTDLPEDPRAYSIHYRALKPSMEERKAQAEVLKTEADMGIASQIDVIRGLHPEIESDEEALERLLRVKEIQKDLALLDQPMAPDAPEPEPEADAPEPEAVEEAAQLSEPEAENVQLTALNGAQVQAAQGIVQAVADGQLPRASGVQMLSAFFNLPMQSAEQIMGEVGRGFLAVTEEPPPSPEEG